MVGWLVTEVTVKLQNVNFILIHFTKSKVKSLFSIVFIYLPHLSRIRLKKVVLSCNNAKTSSFVAVNQIGIVDDAG